MRENGLRARPRRRGLPKDTGERAAVSDNLLDRAFEASAPNQKWVADFTYIWTAEGWLYVAAVVALFSRRVVGWAMKAEMTAQLVSDALIMAIWRRGKPDSLLHHSDQGSQYTSLAFGARWAEDGREALGKLWGVDHAWTKLAGVLTCVALAILFFGKMTYRVEAPFQLRLAGRVIRGRIDAVYREPGAEAVVEIPVV
jgi:hypothetical protein